MRKIENNRSLKVLSAAVLAGVALCTNQAFAVTDSASLEDVVTQTGDREFNLNEGEKYTVGNNLGTMGTGSLTINGADNAQIDMNGNAGITVGAGSVLNMNNVNVTGLVDGRGIILDSGNIGTITGTFKDNYSPTSEEGFIIKAHGDFNVDTINASFINNKGGGTWGHGGVIYFGGSKTETTATVNQILGNFINNGMEVDYGYDYGGAVTIYGPKMTINIKLIDANFDGNFVLSHDTENRSWDQTVGGALSVSLSSMSSIDNIKGRFTNNSAIRTTDASSVCDVGGGAIFVRPGNGIIKNINSYFENNYAKIDGANGKVMGGAIYNKGNIGKITNTDFINNYTFATTGTAEGGAIYSTTDLNIIADGATSTFRGNYTQVGDVKDDNAIYASNAATINFETKNNGRIDMYDNIRGASVEVTETDADGNELLDADGNKLTTTKNYSVNITGDNTGTFGMYNDIYNANVSMGNTTINTLNNLTHTYNFNSLTLTGDTNFIADVDLKNKQMDRFTAASYGEHQGNLNVVGMNLLSDATSDKTEVFFAEQGLKNNVTTTVKELNGYTPIYKYNVTYNNKPDGGYFVFQRGSNGGNSSDAFNPSVLASPVSTTAATQATVNETFKYVFEHADAFTQLPSVERISRINLNKYALNQEKYNGYSTDYNTNLGSLNPTLNNKAGWFRPYVTFENMHLNHGPKVNAITYGSLVGYDTDFNEHKHGWYSVGTGYIGYNGSQLNYSNTDTTMNGGLLGYTHTFYKGNFWSALTATAGASVGESKSMYGKENFTTLLAGIGSKTGYNFEFKKGKFIVQPIMFMSYTFANTFDYTNAAGVKINNSPAHSIQLNPSVRFIANTKNNWQPYASVGMVWNVMNENKVTANNVRLPEMSMKPYVEYGLGLQRNWKDKFTAFGQAMIRNGGRNGIALTAGFRWSLGKEGKPIEKVNNETLKQVQGDKGVNVNTLSKGEGRVRVQSAQPTVSTRTELENRHSELVSESQSILGGKVSTAASRTVLKQLTPTQKTALGAKPQNTTRTTNSAILKQM